MTDTKDRTGLAAPTPTVGRPEPPSPGDDVTVGYLFRRIYQFFYSKTVGLVIILAMAVMVLLGVIIGQAPAGTYDSAEARAAFVEQAQGKLGGWAKVFDALGLFRVFSSPAFIVVTVLLALSIIACTVHRIPQLWQRYRHPRVHVSERFFDKARYRGEVVAHTSPDAAAQVVAERLRAARYRVLPDAGTRGMYADKYGWGGFGTVVAHAAMVVILAAFAISASGGVDEYLSLPEGAEPVALGHDTGLSVQATDFTLTSDEDGRPLDYVSHLVLSDATGVVAEHDVRVNDPLRYDGLKFHQTGYGISADVSVTGPEGTLVETALPLRTTSDGLYRFAQFELPTQELDVVVILPASSSADLEAGQAAFEVYRTGQSDPLSTLTADQGQAVSLGELSFTFEREREYTGITMRQDPGAIWMWIGSGLLVLGMMVTFTCRHRRVWVRVEDDGRVRFASPDKEDTVRQRQFDDAVFDIADALDADVVSVKEGTS